MREAASVFENSLKRNLLHQKLHTNIFDSNIIHVINILGVKAMLSAIHIVYASMQPSYCEALMSWNV